MAAHDELPKAPRADSSATPSDQALVLGTGARRVRLSMYLAFAALAVAVLVQGWRTLRFEELRAIDAAVLEQAGQQRTTAEHIARLAVQVAARPDLHQREAEELAALLAQSAGDALTLQDMLAHQLHASAETARRLAPALEQWQGARERLWYRSQALLRQAEEGDDKRLHAAAAAVQEETAAAALASKKLSAALRDAAQRRTDGLRTEVRLGCTVLLVLLAALALGVVEPTARAVRRHGRRLREQALELQRLALVAEHTSALVVITGRDDRVLWVNAAFTRMTGWTLGEAAGRRPGALVTSPRADAAIVQRVDRAVAEGHGVRQEWLHRTRDGRELWLDVDLRPLRSAETGELTGFVRVCTDTTARVHQQAKLQALWAALPAGVVVQSADGDIVEANRTAERLLGRTLAQMQTLDLRDRAWEALRPDGSPCPGQEHPAWRTLKSGRPQRNQTIGVRTPQGELRWLLVNTEPQVDTLGQHAGVVSCFTDVTEIRALQDRLTDSARTDALTRLPNRTVVMERLQHAIDHAARHPGYGFAVLFMDFDRFKQVNDTLGHGAGDELLRQIAQRLQRTLRPGDALARLEGGPAGDGTQVAARLGGDEFVVVLEGVGDVGTVGVVAQRLLEEVAEPYTIGGTSVQSSASIGIVLHTGLPDADGSARPPTAEAVLRNADTAMYEAKRAGRNRWVLFDDSMHERVVRQLAIESDLRLAIKEGELFTVYQPVVDLATQSMVGVEALVRWRHPTRGVVAPGEFIGVAEDCGLIDAVGETVLRQACTQFVAWQRTIGAAAPRLLAVNLSRAQLERSGLVADVAAALRDCGMRPEQLQLEVTESLAAQDERVQSTLRELKKIGVRLALDDFGTGYSSLACLHQMPVDTVKIDRSFVQHAETVEYHRVLIEATIRVARTLGMTTVAEGIECPGQAALMRELDCDRGQGFLFSRPLEAAEIERWARSRAGAPGSARGAGKQAPPDFDTGLDDFDDDFDADTDFGVTAVDSLR